MRGVLVVDDEPFVRLSIASLRDWESDGFDFRHEASNGREALDLIRSSSEIDIVLLDLSMPVMNGIEFLERLPAELSGSRQPAVIVLSAYDDFHLVRKAFTLGARDYLLKSEMDGDSLLALLKKADEAIGDSRERSAAVIERRHIDFLKSQFLRDLLAGQCPEDSAELFAGLGIDLDPPFFVCCFRVEDFQAVAARYAGEGIASFSAMLERSLAQILAKRGSGEVLVVKPDEAVAFFNSGESREAGDFCVDAREYLERYLSVRCSFSIGPVCRTSGEVPGAYSTAIAQRTVESRIVVQAKRFIREKFQDPELSLEEVSERVGVSKNHLSWEFSRETGRTFTEYLAGLRIEEAKRLLSETNLKVYEVGETVGYPNVEHFSRLFKKLTGTSPGAWKSRSS
jgi:two-component system, response regulator YesN